MDKHVQHKHDPPPLRPLPTPQRYAGWPASGDPCVRRIRTEVQEGGRGLFVLRGRHGAKHLVEAYYPSDISDAYAGRWLTPPQLHDFSMGRLVVVAELHTYTGELPDDLILNLRKNNRDARRDLKRKVSRLDIEQHSRDLHDKAWDEDMKRAEDAGMIDAYVEALEDTRKYGGTAERVTVPHNID